MDPFDTAWDAAHKKKDPFDAAWDAATPAPPSPPTQPTWGQSAKFVGKSLVQGLAKNADLANSLNPFGFPHPPNMIQNEMASRVGVPEDVGITGNVADFANTAVQASTFPVGGPIPNALSAVGGEVAHKMFPDSKLAPIVGSVGTGLGLTAFEKAASGLMSAGKAFERASIGATASDYIKDMKAKGLIDDADAGEYATTLSKSINEIGSTEGWGVLRDPQRLAARNNAALTETGGKIGGVLKAVDQVGVAPKVALDDPNSFTQQLISKANVAKADLREALGEFASKFYDPVDGWKGTTSDLNAWKSGMASMGFSGTVKGTLPAATARKLQRAISFDLGKAVDDAVTTSGVTDPKEWSDLMSVYSNHKAVEPIINSNVAGGLGNTWDKMARGMLRTSGGTLTTPTIIGTALGMAGGPVIGLATGATLSAATSPTGRGLLGNTLKGVGGAGQTALRGSAVSPLAGIMSVAPQTFLPRESDAILGSQQHQQTIAMLAMQQGLIMDPQEFVSAPEPIKKGIIKQIAQSNPNMFQVGEYGFRSLFDGRIDDPMERDTYMKMVKDKNLPPGKEAEIIGSLLSDKKFVPMDEAPAPTMQAPSMPTPSMEQMSSMLSGIVPGQEQPAQQMQFAPDSLRMIEQMRGSKSQIDYARSGG